MGNYITFGGLYGTSEKETIQRFDRNFELQIHSDNEARLPKSILSIFAAGSP